MNVATPTRLGVAWRALATGVLGAAFALALHQLWDLEGRWFVVAVVGIGLVGVGLMFAGRMSDFLLVAMLFCVPLAGFAKWSFLEEYPETTQEAALYLGTLGVGISDFIILGMYLVWAGRILVLRTEPWPKVEKLDVWVGLLLLACAISLWGARLKLGLFAFEHLLKHALVYFYVSRHFQRRHVPWLFGTIAFAISLEAALGVLQYFNIVPPGLILDKGRGSDLLDKQYRVPGIEDISRATGSLYDSHALGTYLTMLMPYAVVYLFKQGAAPIVRLACVGFYLVGFAGLIVTYSRSGWLATAISTSIVVMGLAIWRERGVIPTVSAVLAGVILTFPWVFGRIFARLFEAPGELIQVRFQQFPIAWEIWKPNFLFGTGAGNYMEQMDVVNTDWSLNEPVHNVPLFIGAETGLFGVIAYYGLVAAALWMLVKLMRGTHDASRRIALAAFGGLIAYIFDGMSNPLFREPTVYMWFWLTVGIALALDRESRQVDPVPCARPA